MTSISSSSTSVSSIVSAAGKQIAETVLRQLNVEPNEKNVATTTLALTAATVSILAWWWVRSKPPRNRKLRYVASSNSALGSPEKEASKQEMDRMFKELHEAFEENVTHAICDKGRWDYAWRIQQLYGLLDMFEENQEAFYNASKADIGRSRSEFVLEAGATLSDMDHIIAGLKKWMKPSKRGTPLWMMPASSCVISEPLGVCLILGTWNYAAMTCILPLAGALAAGNSVIVKPSEIAPAQSELLAKLLPKYVDPTAVRVIQGGPATAQTLVESYEWGKVFYTGGSKVGASIAVSCSARLIPTCLELGGKSPTIILDDADLKVSCRRIVQGKFVNSGQTCIAPDYIIIVGSDARKKEAIDALVREVEYQFSGDILAHPEYARVVSSRHYARLESMLKSGGKIIRGGKAYADQKCIEPTLLVDCPLDAPILTEEIFGPLLPILTVDTPDQAVAFVRSKPKPLTLYVFSNNRKKADYVIAHTTSGSACVNEAVFQYLNPYLPFGGVSASGHGAYHGEASFLVFSHNKSIVYRSAFADLYFRYLPHLGDAWVQKLFTFLLRL